MKAAGQTAFEAYNQAGANPGKTWDGKPVPAWEELTPDVREKWVTTEHAVRKARLDEFGPWRPLSTFLATFGRAHERFDRACFEHNGALDVRVLLEFFEEELRRSKS